MDTCQNDYMSPDLIKLKLDANVYLVPIKFLCKK